MTSLEGQGEEKGEGTLPRGMMTCQKLSASFRRSNGGRQRRGGEREEGWGGREQKESKNGGKKKKKGVVRRLSRRKGGRMPFEQHGEEKRKADRWTSPSVSCPVDIDAKATLKREGKGKEGWILCPFS